MLTKLVTREGHGRAVILEPYTRGQEMIRNEFDQAPPKVWGSVPRAPVVLLLDLTSLWHGGEWYCLLKL